MKCPNARENERREEESESSWGKFDQSELKKIMFIWFLLRFLPLLFFSFNFRLWRRHGHRSWIFIVPPHPLLDGKLKVVTIRIHTITPPPLQCSILRINPYHNKVRIDAQWRTNKKKKKKNERSCETLTIDEHDLTVSYSNNEDLFSLWWLIMIGILVVFSSDDKYQKKRLGQPWPSWQIARRSNSDRMKSFWLDLFRSYFDRFSCVSWSDMFMFIVTRLNTTLLETRDLVSVDRLTSLLICCQILRSSSSITIRFSGACDICVLVLSLSLSLLCIARNQLSVLTGGIGSVCCSALT